MKEILIKKLEYANFKGQTQDLEFKKITNIVGANGVGKTAVADAFNWLLFGKNSKGSAQFNIQPLNDSNQIINADVTVTGVFDVDGKEVKLQKVLKTKYKKEGITKLANGTTTDYFIGEEKVKEKDYDEFIASNFAKADLFTTLTNPMNFADSKKWTERRAVLLEMVEGRSDSDIAKNHADFMYLAENLKDNSLESLINIAKFKIKGAKEKQIELPTRITEVKESFYEVAKEEDELIKDKQEITEKKVMLESTGKDNQTELVKREISRQLLEKQTELNKMQAEANSKKRIEENAILDEKYKIERELKSKERLVLDLQADLKSLDREIEDINRKGESLNIDFDNTIKLQKETYDLKFIYEHKENDNLCPCCGQELPKEQLANKEKMAQDAFNVEKEKKLKDIASTISYLKNTGARLKQEKEKAINDIAEKEKNIEVAKEEVKVLETNLEVVYKKEQELRNKTYLEEELSTLNKEYLELKGKLDNVELEKDDDTIATEIKNLEAKLTEINSNLEKLNENKRKNIRILELEEELDIINKDYLKYLKQLDDLKKFEEYKTRQLEEDVNSKFKNVQFRLFKRLVNGSIEPDCEALIKTKKDALVDFTDANNAARYNAGLDIINTLSSHYGVKAPVFLDNREGITEILETDLQIINLEVNKDYKVLTVLN